MQNSKENMQSITGSAACRIIQTTCSPLQAVQHAEQDRQHAVHYRRCSMQNSTDNMQSITGGAACRAGQTTCSTLHAVKEMVARDCGQFYIFGTEL
jgi:hypothetical protein